MGSCESKTINDAEIVVDTTRPGWLKVLVLLVVDKKRFIPSHTHRKQAAKFALWEDGLALESSRFNKTGTTVPGFNGFSF